MQNKELLEQAVIDLGPTPKRPKNLYAAVIDYLTYGGESATLAQWIMQSHLAEGRVTPPVSDKPVVSVIIPCFNHAEYLPECIASVVRQSFSALEIIVIDDGSTDNTRAIAQQCIDEYPQHAIRYVAQENSGLVASRNRGITLAKGDLILPLDADDLIAPSFLEATAPLLMGNPDLGYVSTKALFFGDSNKIWPNIDFNPFSFFAMNQQTCTTLFRKAMWKDLHGYSTEMVHGYEDWEFWIRATQQGWMGTQIDQPLFFYRRKKQSMLVGSRDKDVMIKEQIVRLNPAVYDASKLPEVRDELTRPNWIPPQLIREEVQIRRRPSANTDHDDQKNLKAQQQALEEKVRKALACILPDLASHFTPVKSAASTPEAFAALAPQMMKRTEKFFALQSPARAIEMAALLLAQHPLEKLAATHVMQTLARTGNLSAAHALGSFYLSIWHWDKDILGLLSQLLCIQADFTDSPTQKLGLLEGAALFAPHSPLAFGKLFDIEQQAGMHSVAERTWQQAKHFSLALPAPAPRTPKQTADSERKHIWYVADGFGASNSGVNGVTQARYMTLAALLDNNDLYDVTIVTPMNLGLPLAIAEFAHQCHALREKEDAPWPEWIPTVRKNTSPGIGIAGQTCMQGEWLPCRIPSHEPDLIIIEGVRTLPHDYLQELGLPFTCPKVQIHHCSPRQYSAEFTDGVPLPTALDALESYDFNICVSESVTQEWRETPEANKATWFTIHNCIREYESAEVVAQPVQEIREKLGLPADAFLMLCLASIQTRKGQDILLEQLDEIITNVPSAHLVLVGPVLDNWGGSAIVQQARNSAHSDRIHLLGPKTNALEYVHASDLLILPSREEALPLSILEGMALHTPCVASDVNGIPELIVHGETGYMFPLAQPHKLAEYVVALANAPERLADMAQKGHKRYWDHFSHRQHARKWRDVLGAIFATSSTPTKYTASAANA